MSPTFEFIGTETVLQQLANYGQIVAGLTSVVIAGSVLLLWRQVRLQAQTGQVEMVTGITSMIISVSEVFVEHPRMWKYFHEGATPAGVKYERARAIAATLANAVDHASVHLDYMDYQTRGAWKAYIASVYSNSPIFREYLEAHPDWYPMLRKQLGIGGCG